MNAITAEYSYLIWTALPIMHFTIDFAHFDGISRCITQRLTVFYFFFLMRFMHMSTFWWYSVHFSFIAFLLLWLVFYFLFTHDIAIVADISVWLWLWFPYNLIRKKKKESSLIPFRDFNLFRRKKFFVFSDLILSIPKILKFPLALESEIVSSKNISDSLTI